MSIKAIKTKVITAFIVVFMAFFAFSPVVLAADDYGLTDSAGEAGYKTDGTVTTNIIVGKIITTALSLLGVIFLVLMIYGGFLWMTARGDEGQVTKAKDLMQAAIIGLVVVISAYAISYFVISTLSTGTLK